MVERGEQEFYFANHLGNNLLILSDKKTGIDDNDDGISDRYMADVISATDYSAYGENLPGREFKSSLIQFGFNSKWNDSETGYQDYGMRMYSSKRRGFLSVDPLAAIYSFYSPLIKSPLLIAASTMNKSTFFTGQPVFQSLLEILIS